ncbi:MAG: glycosyltransferase family 39 protein [Planctomycetes bacterium]|nr:glycosyltransferase family 39 protein [Planctomycetota bacterium]
MSDVTSIANSPIDRSARRWDDLAAVTLLVILVSLIYGARLTRQPIAGEESRWATGAREMLATGDWIVPRQQGQVFPERPPMTMWAMAAAGWVRGDVDLIAIRLPSVIAIVLTTIILYVYARKLASPFAALVAALVYATMGQVLQIGRQGESEALFALFVSASLLLWHLGYMRGWPVLATWCIGFGCAALAALVKGPQAPVYFVAITAVYLTVRRDLQYLVRWQYAAAACVFATFVAAWQIPFYLATDWPTVAATWSGLAADRIHLGGLAKHIVTYPLETFACLLPWSPLLVALMKRETRELLADRRPVTTFLFTALLVAYPTVWLATGARGRYFMPLYPLVAVLIALVIERCSAAKLGGYSRHAWHQFLLLCSVLIGIGGMAIGVGGSLPNEWIGPMHQPVWFCLALAAAAAGVVYVLWSCYRTPRRFVPVIAVLAIATFAGAAYTGAVINVNAARWTDPTQVVSDLKQQLPSGTTLVSLTPIEHRFAYYFREPIAQLEWPQAPSDLPSDVEYFCFMRHPGDTARQRFAGRGRTMRYTSGTLPFAWTEITSICVDRTERAEGRRTIVLGRVVRPIRAEISDATRPQPSVAQRSDGAERTSL